MTTTHRYLLKIQAGEPINLEALIAQLGRAGVPEIDISRILVGQKISKAKPSYAVTVIDALAFDSLLARFQPSDVQGRTGAALDGNSHAVGVSESILIFRSEYYPHPTVAITDQGEWVVPRLLGPIGVIVENLENFLRFHETIAFIGSILPFDFNEFELIYGSGNQVTNSLNAPVLKRFDVIYCLFDVDVGGMRMFKTLKTLLPGQAINFLAPTDMHGRLTRSKNLLSDEHRIELFEKYRDLSPETDRLISCMRATGRILEQETYLAAIAMDGEQ